MPDFAASEPTPWPRPLRVTRYFLRPVLTVSLIAQLLACVGSSRPVPLAPSVDLKAIQGGWYIVATIPNHLEKGMVAPFDVYSQRANGDIHEDFTVRFGGFDAKSRHFPITDSIVAGSNNTSWRVHIFGLLSLPLLALYADLRYRYVLFGENGRSLGGCSPAGKKL